MIEKEKIVCYIVIERDNQNISLTVNTKKVLEWRKYIVTMGV